MMDQAIKEQWVVALRSGEYRQGQNVLHRIQEDNATFCCLGVLCDLAVKAGVPIRTNHDATCQCPRCHRNRIVFYDGQDDFLPESVKNWARLEAVNPSISLIVHGVRATLSYLNDNGSTFTEIADIIEAEL